MRSARSARLSMAIALRGRLRAHPFDGDRAAAGADVPEQLARARAERGDRHGAHVALGELAVGGERVVGQAGRARVAGGAGDGDRHYVEWVGDEVGRRGCRRVDAPLVRAAELLEHGERAVAEAALGQDAGESRGAVAAGHVGDDAAAALERADGDLGRAARPR